MMRAGRGIVGFWIVVSLWLAGAGVSALSSKEESKQHFDAGNALVENEDYTAAAAEFELSVSLYPTKMGLFNLANCYKAMSRYGDALEALTTLERDFAGKLGSIKGDVELLMNTIEGMVGRVEVKVDQPNASILVDGKTVGKSPLDMPQVLSPGEHVVEVRLAGYETANQTARIAARNVTVLSFRLKQEEKSVAANASDKPLIESSVQPVQTETKPVDVEKDGNKKGLRVTAWASLAVAIGSGVFSGVFYGKAAGKTDDFNKASEKYGSLGNTLGASAQEPLLWEEMMSAQKDNAKFKNLGLSFAIGAGVFAATGVTLFILGRSGKEKAAGEATVSFAPDGLRVAF